MAVTIYDVAERAGVGIATVSRVLNNSPQVREITRKRVQVAMQELNYHPSAIAQRLSSRKGLALGVVVPFFTRSSFIERLRGVEAAVAESEYDLVVYNVESPEKRDRTFQEVPLRHQLDGMLVISLAPTDEDVDHFQRCELPVVLVGAGHPRLNRVVVDDIEGGRMATQHLIDLGHRRIEFVAGSLDNPFRFTPSRDRYRGYRQAMDAAGLATRGERHLIGEHSQFQAKVLTEQILDEDDPPTAIFASSDTRAMGVLEALQERRLRVPDDVGVIGYDDIEMATYLGLTTIRQPLYESGLRGVEMLLDLIEQPARAPVETRLPLTLMKRGTTGPAS